MLNILFSCTATKKFTKKSERTYKLPTTASIFTSIELLKFGMIYLYFDAQYYKL